MSHLTIIIRGVKLKSIVILVSLKCYQISGKRARDFMTAKNSGITRISKLIVPIRDELWVSSIIRRGKAEPVSFDSPSMIAQEH